MTIEGVSGPTKRVGKNNLEVRRDGFGTMSDEDVNSYRELRAERYHGYQYYELAKRVTALEEAADGPN